MQTRHLAAMAMTMVLSVFSVPAQSSLVFEATLAPEAFGATGSGFVTLTYDPTAHTLGIEANWTGLSGTTTVAHVHCCTASPGTGTAGVAVSTPTLPAFPSGVTLGTYDVVLDLTAASTYSSSFITFGGGTIAGAEAALLSGMTNGTAYFNIHTTNFGGGEIRGFTQPVPEPATLGLLGLGLLGLAASRQRHASATQTLAAA